MSFLSATATFRPRSAAGQFIEAYVTPGVVAALIVSTQAVAQVAQSICPVDTGALRDSIVAEPPVVTDLTAEADISAGMFYAGYVEYGTGIRGSESEGAGPYPYDPKWPGMAAQPYMRPALDMARDQIREAFASQIALSLNK
jgi:hypothetical protein